MNNNPTAELFTRLVSGLSDNDLNELRTVVYWEEDKRIQKKIKEGKYPELNFNEQVAIRSNNKIGAIKEYRIRNDISSREAKLVVEAFT